MYAQQRVNPKLGESEMDTKSNRLNLEDTIRFAQIEKYVIYAHSNPCMESRDLWLEAILDIIDRRKSCIVKTT